MDRDLAPLRRLLLVAALAVAACAALPTLASANVLEPTPSSVTFSPQILGTRSSTQPVFVSNMTPGPEGTGSVSLVGADFIVLSENCENRLLQEGESCAISVAFEPQASGTRVGALEIARSGGGVLVVPLEGQGFTKQVTVPATQAFPITTLGTTTTQQVALKNESEADLTISQIKLEGADAGDFKLENNCTGPMMKGTGCVLSVGFVPSATGERTAQLKVLSDGLPSEQFIALSGEGAAPDLSFEPASVDFGLTEVHAGGNQQTLTLRNTGPALAQLGNVEITGPDANEFFVPGNNCSGSQLLPGATCTIQTQFNANNEGTFNAAVRVAAGTFAFEAPLSGRAERPQVQPSAFPFDFGATGVGSGRARELTLTNTGNLPVGFFIAIVSGGDESSFQMVEENCTGHVILPGESCSALIRFRPQGAGLRTATASFFGSGEGALQVPLEGIGAAPQLTLSPETHDFGSVAVGAPGPVQVFQLRNDSGDPYAVDSVGLAGADLGEFAIRSDDCSDTTLAPGEACAVAVRFDPETAGAKAAKLRLRGDAGSTVAQLSGNATTAVTAAAPMAAVAPSRAAANRVVFQLRSQLKIGGGKRLLIGRARCESSQPCVIKLGGTATASAQRPATLPLGPSQVTIAAGRTVPLALVVPATLRSGPGATKIAVTLRWRSGGERGRASRTFAVPR